MTEQTDIELDDIAARALASIILERTADGVRDGGEHAAEALLALRDNTGLELDVCAAVMQATSWLAGAGGLTADEVFGASLAYVPDEADEATDGGS